MSSTSKHSSANVKGAVYLNTAKLRSLHARCLHIICLNPRNTITVANAVDLEDEDIPSQRSHQVRIEGVSESTILTSDQRCTTKCWLKANNSFTILRTLCTTHLIPFEDKFQRKH